MLYEQQLPGLLTATPAEPPCSRASPPATPQASWLPELLDVVSSINTTFSASFADIGCAGEVALYTANGDDYDKYAIQVRRARGRARERTGWLSQIRTQGVTCALVPGAGWELGSASTSSRL